MIVSRGRVLKVWIAALIIDVGDIAEQAELLGLRRNITISKDDAGYITSIEDLRSEGILDNDTADSYLLGIPVERLQ